MRRRRRIRRSRRRRKRRRWRRRRRRMRRRRGKIYYSININAKVRYPYICIAVSKETGVKAEGGRPFGCGENRKMEEGEEERVGLRWTVAKENIG